MINNGKNAKCKSGEHKEKKKDEERKVFYGSRRVNVGDMGRVGFWVRLRRRRVGGEWRWVEFGEERVGWGR